MNQVPVTQTRPAFPPYPLIGVGVIAVSFAAVLIKLAAAPPLVIAFYRMLFTFLMLAPLAWGLAREDLRRISRRDWIGTLAAGFSLALHFASWISSLRYTSVASSTVLVTTQPVFVVLGSWLLFRERFPTRALMGLALAFGGSSLIGLSDFRVGGQALWGDLLALVGAVTFAAYLLLGRGLRQRLAILPYTALVYGSCTLVLLLFCLFNGLPLYPYAPGDFAIFATLAFLSTVIGHSIFNWAVKFVAAPVIAVSILGEPVGATLLAALLLRETPTLLQLAGGGVILVGITVFIVSSQGGAKKEGTQC